MIIALTGATGFLGRRLIPALLAQGHEVRALTRREPREHPAGLTWVPGDLQSPQALAELARGTQTVIHAAASLRGTKHAHFDMPNRLGTAAVIEAANQAGVERFIHVSSLAARAPGLSHYATSKHAAEALVMGESGLNWTVLRPPAVYGPGDTATLPFFKSVARGIAPRIGGGERPFSMIHVDDLISAIIFLLNAPSAQQLLVEIDDGRENGYTLPQLFGLIGNALDKKPVPLVIPVPALWLGAHASRLWSGVTGSAPMFTPEKLRELTAPDWVVKGTHLSAVSDWRPAISGPEGIAATAAWYKGQGWL